MSNRKLAALVMVWCLTLTAVAGTPAVLTSAAASSAAGNVDVGNSATEPLEDDSHYFAGQTVQTKVAADGEYTIEDGDGVVWKKVTPDESGVLSVDTAALPESTLYLVAPDGSEVLSFGIDILDVSVQSGEIVYAADGDGGAYSPYRVLEFEANVPADDFVFRSPEINLQQASPADAVGDEWVVEAADGVGEGSLLVDTAALEDGSYTIEARHRETLVGSSVRISSSNSGQYRYEKLDPERVEIQDGGEYWTSNTFAYDTGDPETQYNVYSNGKLEQRAITFENGLLPLWSLEPGEQNLAIKPADSKDQVETLSVSVRNQSMWLDADQRWINPAEQTETSLTLSSNRDGYNALLYSPDLTRDQLLEVVPAAEAWDGHARLSDVSASEDLTADLEGVSPGTYRIHATVPTTDVDTSVEIAVLGQRESSSGTTSTSTATESSDSSGSSDSSSSSSLKVDADTPTPTPTATPEPTESADGATSMATPEPETDTAGQLSASMSTEPSTEASTFTETPARVSDTAAQTAGPTASPATENVETVSASGPGFGVIATLVAVGLSVTLYRV